MAIFIILLFLDPDLLFIYNFGHHKAYILCFANFVSGFINSMAIHATIFGTLELDPVLDKESFHSAN